jgi:hypothetical protein
MAKKLLFKFLTEGVTTIGGDSEHAGKIPLLNEDGLLDATLGGGGGGGGIGGSTGSTDNAILRANGTGGAALQSSGLTISDVAATSVTVTPTTGNSLIFTTLDNNKNITLTPHGTGVVASSKIAFTGGNIDGVIIGATTPAAASVTTLSLTGAITFPDGVKQTFNPDATTPGINVGSIAGDPSTPANGDLWYDSTANELTARINGANVALGSTSGLLVAANNLSDLISASTARTNLGLVIGTDVLAPNGSGASLTALNASNLGSGTVPDARFPATLPALSGVNLTALTAANITASTTLGRNVLNLTNPDAVTYLRVNADNTVTARSAANFLADIGGIDGSSLNASNLSSGIIPDGRMPNLTGDVTTVEGAVATTIANDAVTTAKILNANVTLAKIANASANSKLLGSGAFGSGAAYSEITLGTNLSMSGTTLNAAGGGGSVVRETFTGNATLTTGTNVADYTGSNVPAPRYSLTLPPAVDYDAGETIRITDVTGGINASGQIRLLPDGTDDISSYSYYDLRQTHASTLIASNGVDGWAVLDERYFIPSQDASGNLSFGITGQMTFYGTGDILAREQISATRFRVTAAGNHVCFAQAADGVAKLEDYSNAGISLQFGQISSLGTPSSNSVRIGALDHSGTSKLYMVHENGDVFRVAGFNGSDQLPANLLMGDKVFRYFLNGLSGAMLESGYLCSVDGFAFGNDGNNGLMRAPSDGVFLFQNRAQTDFSRLMFGGTTTSFPALKRSSATIQVRLADDSDYADFRAAGLTGTTLSLSGAVTFPDDVRQTFNPGSTNAGLNVGSIAGDPSSPSNGDLWYDSTANELTARINGANVALSAGGGSGNVNAGGTLTNNALVIGQGSTDVATTTTGTGILTFLGTPSSANLRAALTDKTGTGVAVFSETPTINDANLTGTTTVDEVNTTTMNVDTMEVQAVGISRTLGTDDTCSGTLLVDINAGTTIAQWEAVYYSFADGEWMLADANAAGAYPAQGLAVAAGTNGVGMDVLIQGFVRNDTWNWSAGPIYLSTTAGGLTQTAPSTSGDQVQIVGYAVTADVAYFHFNQTYVTVE